MRRQQQGEETEMTDRRRFITAGLAFGVATAVLGGFARVALAQASPILSEVQKRGIIRIATVAGNPPYSSIKPDGTPEGYDIDIGNEFAAALKVKPEWIIVDSPGRITALQTGKADMTVANFTNTLERSTAIAFTRPYVIVGSNYMVKTSSPLQKVEQVNKPGIKVGVPRGGTAEGICQANTPNAEMVRFNTVTDAFLALKSGQVDTQILDSLQDASFLAQEGASFRNLPGNYSYEEIAIGLPAGDADWFRILDAFVRQLVGSGEDARLFKKWFGYDLPPL
jgi:polar amino acid transport system substrate-binding protein